MDVFIQHCSFVNQVSTAVDVVSNGNPFFSFIFDSSSISNNAYPIKFSVLTLQVASEFILIPHPWLLVLPIVSFKTLLHLPFELMLRYGTDFNTNVIVLPPQSSLKIANF